MEMASFRAVVRFSEQDFRVIRVFEALLPGEQLPGLTGWVIRDVKVRADEVNGVETQWEIWVEPTADRALGHVDLTRSPRPGFEHDASHDSTSSRR
jgi:hypothetical protein